MKQGWVCWFKLILGCWNWLIVIADTCTRGKYSRGSGLFTHTNEAPVEIDVTLMGRLPKSAFWQDHSDDCPVHFLFEMVDSSKWICGKTPFSGIKAHGKFWIVFGGKTRHLFTESVSLLIWIIQRTLLSTVFRQYTCYWRNRSDKKC